MITRWFSRMVAAAFKREMSAAEMKGYRRGREAGYADGLDRGFDKAVVPRFGMWVASRRAPVIGSLHRFGG